MKVAIYSRVLESTQQKDVQLFFDELDKEKIKQLREMLNNYYAD